MASAHLHLMTRDALDSSRHCYRDGVTQLYTIHQWVSNCTAFLKNQNLFSFWFLLSRLVGKLESMMCLILQMEGRKGNRLGDFYPVIENLLTTTVLPRYFDCSAKYANIWIDLAPFRDFYFPLNYFDFIFYRRTRTCLVIRYTSEILKSVQILFFDKK